MTRIGAFRTRTSVAFAPGHVTGMFCPAPPARDPRARGSIGAGLVLSRGAWAFARWRIDGPPRTAVVDPDGRPLPISGDVAQRLRAGRPGSLRVQVVHELPVGSGFGMSAAGALATGVAVAALAGHEMRVAIETAHLADLFGRGGLGGVAAVLHGGAEFRRSPGIPPFGEVVHRRWDWPVYLGVVGAALPTPRVLANDRRMAEVARAFEAAGGPLGRRATVPDALEAAERFTDALALAPPELRRAIRELRRRGAWAAQAMFGRAFWAVPKSKSEVPAIERWLAAQPFPTWTVRTSRTGPRLVIGATDIETSLDRSRARRAGGGPGAALERNLRCGTKPTRVGT